MKRKIEYAVKNEGDRVLMQITGQTARGNEFGKGLPTAALSGSRVMTPNGVTLSSQNCPENSCDILYVRGEAVQLDLRWFPVALDHLGRILEAIEWYNVQEVIVEPPKPKLFGIDHIPEYYRNGAEQLIEAMGNLIQGDDLDEIPKEYRKAAVAAYAIKVFGYASYEAALNDLGCQKDNAAKMFTDLADEG